MKEISLIPSLLTFISVETRKEFEEPSIVTSILSRLAMIKEGQALKSSSLLHVSVEYDELGFGNTFEV